LKPYFGKQVIEAPRRGSRSATSAKARFYGRLECDPEDGWDYDGFTRLPVSRRQEGYHNKKIGSKSFSDVLGPIRNYLQSSIGRPWNDVYSELRRELGSGAWPIRHILEQHVDVSTHTYRGVDGNVWVMGTLGRRGWAPHAVECRSGEFYVEPETGILRYSGQRKRWRWTREKKADRMEIDGIRYGLVNGLWFVVAEVEYVQRGKTITETRTIKSCSKREIRMIRRRLATGSAQPRY